MSDELTLLKEIGSDTEQAMSGVEEQAHRALLAAIAGETVRARARRPRRPLALGFAGVAAACGTVIVALALGGGTPTIAERALAAVSSGTGVMHYVAVDDDLSRSSPYLPNRGRRYEEAWINLADPSRSRTVYTAHGRVDVQVVFVGRSKTFRQTGWKNDRRTLILRSPADPGPGVQSGNDPIEAYRKWLKQATVVSEQATTYRGRWAYKLQIQYKPPYDLVDDVWTGERFTYIVDRDTYYPLESTFQGDPMFGKYATRTRYLKFEILPESPQALALLNPVRNPEPYRP